MARKPTATVEDAAPMLSLIDTPGLPAPTVVDQARVILLDAQRFDQFYDKVKGETDAHVADVSTAAGRAALKSLAFRVTKTHTTLKSASLELTEGWRKQTAAVNAARGPMIERLTALAAEVRKPLTDWEEAEAARVAANDATLSEMRAAAAVTSEDTSVTVTTRGREIYARTFEAPQWLAHEADEAETVKDATVAALVAARNRLAKDEADAAELEVLRREKAERDERDRIEAQAKERIEAKARYARDIIDHIRQCGRGVIGGHTYPFVILLRELEEKIETGDEAAASFGDLADEVERVRIETIATLTEAQAAQSRKAIELAAEQAREDARREAVATAQAERDRVNAAHAAELQTERDRLAAIELERMNERREAARIADEQAAQAAEDARLAKNRAHVAGIMTAAKEAIMTTGLSEDQARAVVVAIKAGLVPAVSISFRKDG